jgi:hypothetical protein
MPLDMQSKHATSKFCDRCNRRSDKFCGQCIFASWNVDGIIGAFGSKKLDRDALSAPVIQGMPKQRAFKALEAIPNLNPKMDSRLVVRSYNRALEIANLL